MCLRKGAVTGLKMSGAVPPLAQILWWRASRRHHERANWAGWSLPQVFKSNYLRKMVHSVRSGTAFHLSGVKRCYCCTVCIVRAVKRLNCTYCCTVCIVRAVKRLNCTYCCTVCIVRAVKRLNCTYCCTVCIVRAVKRRNCTYCCTVCIVRAVKRLNCTYCWSYNELVTAAIWEYNK